MIIISQRLFVSQNGIPVVIQFVDNPPIDFAVWRLEIDGQSHIFVSFADMVHWLREHHIFTKNELAEIMAVKECLLNTKMAEGEENK